MIHELWSAPDGLETFCLAGIHGENARKILPEGSKLVWTVEAKSHFEAMSLLCERRGEAPYSTLYPEIDKRTYKQLGWE